ncbi:family 1 glycosylhydrolase [Longitalea luteola]|uniref:family 1 glycosylhydrolase n=1 Tax=Longitalea luteola TaxID=2812563 RepID=UPI001F607EFA|nr:family 1 glycosylhydrolase [Longitalea luteola]
MNDLLMDKNYPRTNPEIWGGIECTINRIGNTFRDQLDHCGHYTRAGDVERIADLGIRALRYPVLWERHQPVKDQVIDWTWTAQQLQAICKNNMTPIVGLVHHGSGPAHTNLFSDCFASGLAAYAEQVARRFPWLEYFTPVNEPLTTARFSGLYGYWYPHYKDAYSSIVMLLNQVKAIVLAMQAIRRINPAAKLVQTEDLTKIHSTSLLSYQADFENERRWLTYDLLCGRVTRQHPLWDYLLYLGIKESQLNFFSEYTCVPEIMGFNYYVTSERYLDEDLEAYPVHTHGGNGIHAYADVEAVRVKNPAGVKRLLHEAWHRFRLPLAITEAHLHCDEVEQGRWFKEIWDACCMARQEGVDVRAVTAWALLGAYDWCSLLTKEELVYECGVFDISHTGLRPTLTAGLIASLANHGYCDHPLLHQKGWWHHNSRLIRVAESFDELI